MNKSIHFQSPFRATTIWLIVLAFLSIPSIAYPQSFSPVIIDYSNYKEDIVNFNPKVDFYYNKFLAYGDTSTRPDGQILLTDIWNKVDLGQKIPFSNQAYASYHAKVILPPNCRKAIGFLVPAAYTSHTIFINGVPYISEGKVGETKASSEPHFNTKYIILRTGADTMDLLVHISNFYHAKAKFSAPIVFGTEEGVKALFKKSITQDFFVAGSLFMATLFFFSLFLFNKKETSILWFATFTAIYAYRSVGSSFYALHNVYPTMSFFITTRLEYLTLPLSTIAYVFYVNKIYPKQISKPISLILLGLSFSYAAVIIFGSVLLFTTLLTIFLFILVAAIIYGIYVFIKANASKEPGSFYGLISFCFLALAVVLAILDLYNINFYRRTLDFISFIGFFLFQSMVLIHRFAFMLRKAKLDLEKSLEAKTVFLTTMSHEIRTPLNGVIGISQLLQNDKTNLNNEQVEYIEALQFSSSNLLSVVNNILDFEKIEANKLELEAIAFNLKELAQNVIGIYKKQAQEKNLELVLNYDDKLPKYVIADPTKITQVLTNLVNNAVKFTSAGFVGLSISYVDSKGNQTNILFAVTDSGIGIGDEKIKTIFEPFVQADSSVTRSFGGSGLGLTISAKLLQKMGSQLQVTSEMGQGTSFSFYLMVKNSLAPMPSSVVETAGSAHNFAGKKILLVEDNKVNALVAKKILERWQIIVVLANNGMEALSIFEQNKFDLVLMDLQMPLMDGYEASRQIRARSSSLPIIALTANLVENVSKKVTEAGMNDSLSKPFKINELEKILSQFL